MTRKLDKFKSFGTVIGLAVALILAAGWPGVEARADDSSDEYQMKAAYLLNFVQYIEWPAQVFPDANAPIIVAVLGDDPFGDALEQTFQDETIQGRKAVIKRSHRVQDLKDAQLLFISASEKDHIEGILASLSDTSIVTVSETEGFAKHGGIINFYNNGNKIRFEINPDTAQRKGLKISSQLLERARIVSSEDDKGK
jgi:hypothetical protein